MPAQINLGKVRPVDRGEWNEEGTYTILDIVTSNYGSYMSKVGDTETPNTEPLTDRASWIPLADVFALDAAIQEANNSITQLAGDVNELGIKDAVHGAKIKDIENVISTMNPNQSAQLSVSGRKIVSLPKNASNGGMQVKLEGLTAENLVVGGKLITATSYSYISGKTIDVILGNKYYARRLYQTISGTNETATGRISTLSPTHIFVSETDILSRISTYNYESAYEKSIHTYGPQGGTILGEFRDVMIINLTATFGAGNEPDLATCDAMFSDYFEGRKNFEPTGRIRSVGKNKYNAGWELGYIHLTTGQPAAGTNTMRSKNFNKVEPNTKYTFKDNLSYAYRFFEYDENKVFIRYINGAPTTTANTRFIKIMTVNADQTDFAVKAQLESGAIPTTYEPNKETSLYLTAPELRSNGTVKDEIRKGANGYELVKRVGVGATLGSELITNIADREFTSDTGWWGKSLNAVIANGVASVSNATGASAGVNKSLLLTLNKSYRIEFEIKSITPGEIRISIGADTFKTFNAVGKYVYMGVCSGDATLRIYGTLAGQSFEIDNVSVKEVIPQDGAISGTSTFTELSDGTVLYTLATPVVSPIGHGGILNSAENGTVYHEPVIADAGVYGTNMPILLTDYPIASIEEIIKHENGVDTYLDVSTAVIAPDGLSFTHPSLVSGDLVLFTCSFAKETTNGNITATFYDSNVVKIDTVTGKAYKINEVVTNGVLTRTLTEV